MFAGVTAVLTAFVEDVLAAAGAVRVALTGTGGQRGNGSGFMSAVFAEVG